MRKKTQSLLPLSSNDDPQILFFISFIYLEDVGELNSAN
jgi:hypothetical protein